MLLEDGQVVQQAVEDHSVVVINCVEVDDPKQIEALAVLL